MTNLNDEIEAALTEAIVNRAIEVYDGDDTEALRRAIDALEQWRFNRPTVTLSRVGEVGDSGSTLADLLPNGYVVETVTSSPYEWDPIQNRFVQGPVAGGPAL